MNATSCPSRAQWTAYHLGTLPEADAEVLAEHLATCPMCEATVRSLDGLADTVITGLRQPDAQNPYATEPEYRAALAKLQGLRPGAAAGDEAEVASEPQPDAAALGHLGEYRLLEKLGAGGMGTVYKALQTKLRRVVALKLLSKRCLEDAQAAARFEREMAAVGRLDHPNIVRAYDAREIEGAPVLVVEYVDGVDLSELVRRCGALPIPDACELIRQAAVGLQHAHQYGLVHRDIKPSNLMLAGGVQSPGSRVQSTQGAAPSTPSTVDARLPAPVVKILDFGLALLEGPQAAESEQLTSSGQAMGTLDYMAPEQASDSHRVDIRADIFSLGATLYKLLTGQAPFAGGQYDTLVKKLTALAIEPIPPIKQLRADIPEELAHVVHRMLAKKPNERFATPAEVVAALEPFTAGSDLERLLGEAVQGEQAPREAAATISTTDGHCVPAEVDTHPSRPATGPLCLWERVRVKVPGVPHSPRRWAIALALIPPLLIALGVIIYIGKTKLEVPDGSHVQIHPDGKVEVQLPGTDTWGKQPSKAGPPLPGQPNRPKDVLPGLIPRPAKLRGVGRWQLETRLPRGAVTTVAWSPDGKLIACGTEVGNIRICDAATWQLVRLLVGHAKAVRRVAWSPDGSRLASASQDRTVRLWKADGNPGPILAGHRADVGAVAWSPDGQWLASGSDDKTIRFWDAKGTPGPVLEGHAGSVDSVAWSPNGQRLASASRDKTVRLWSADGTLETVLEGHTDAVRTVAWSPDGQTLASGGRDKTVRVWHADGTSGPVLEGHTYWVTSVAWSPDGRRLASSGGLHDRTVRLWKLDGTSAIVLEGHHRRVLSVAWSPDGRQLVSGSGDGTTRLWNSDGTRGPVLENACSSAIRHVAWSPDGRQLASGGPDQRVWLWQSDGMPGPVLEGHTDAVCSVAWSPDGRQLASGSKDNTLRLWQSDGTRGPVLEGHEKWVSCLAWGPDGRQLASGSGDGSVRLWGSDGTRGPVFKGHTGAVRCLAWSPAGRWLASGSWDTTVRLWEADGTPGPVLEPESGAVRSVAWSPDGRHLATADGDGVRLWKPDGTSKAVFPTGAGGAQSVTWSPDSRQLASGHEDSSIRLWRDDGSSGPKLEGHRAAVKCVAWRPTGGQLVSTSGDGTMRLWNLDTGQEQWLAMLLGDGRPVTFSAAGQILHGDPEVIEKELIYLIEKPDGAIELLAPSEFDRRVAAAGAEL